MNKQLNHNIQDQNMKKNVIIKEYEQDICDM